jgi:hypothetical protein
MRLTAYGSFLRRRHRVADVAVGVRTPMVCPRCRHSVQRFRHRRYCTEELQVIYDADGLRCGCDDEFHSRIGRPKRSMLGFGWRAFGILR